MFKLRWNGGALLGGALGIGVGTFIILGLNIVVERETLVQMAPFIWLACMIAGGIFLSWAWDT